MHCGFPWWHYVPELARTFQAHWRGAYSMEPTTLLPVISLLFLVSVEYGAWSLQGFLSGRGQLGSPRRSSSGQDTPMAESCWCLGGTRSWRLRVGRGRALGPRSGGIED